MQSLPIVLEYLSQKDRTPSSQPEHADLPLHRVVRQRTHNLPPEQGKRRLKLKPDANGNKPQWDIYSIQKTTNTNLLESPQPTVLLSRMDVHVAVHTCVVPKGHGIVPEFELRLYRCQDSQQLRLMWSFGMLPLVHSCPLHLLWVARYSQQLRCRYPEAVRLMLWAHR